MNNMELRIHHIFDIIRDFGSNKTFEKHAFGHSYHFIAEKILKEETVFPSRDVDPLKNILDD